jgi:U4/U6.U5 tri-snRNP-associated protein 3
MMLTHKKMRRRTPPRSSPKRKSPVNEIKHDQKKTESKHKHQLDTAVDDKNIEQIMASLGLPVSFETTKGKEVPDNAHNFGLKIKSNRQYRQYMNRKGGFNRLLDPEKTQPKMQ